MTGVVILSSDAETKRLGLLHELVPGLGMIGALINPKFPPVGGTVAGPQSSRARSSTVGFLIANASDDAGRGTLHSPPSCASISVSFTKSPPIHFSIHCRQRIVDFAAGKIGYRRST